MPTFHDSAAALRSNGYLPIPIAPRSKRPLIERWQAYEYRPGDEAKFPADAGAGVLCGLVRGIDIDVMQPRLAKIAIEAARMTWGDMPMRIGRAPKAMLLVRTATAGAKLQSLRFRFPDDPPGSKPHGIEILGLGQQFVAYGTHPDTGREYQWEGAELLEVPFQHLPIATEDELHGYLAACNNLMMEAGGIPSGNLAHRDAQQRTANDELAAYNPEECAAAVAAIANNDLSWDDWIYVGLAIKGALGEEGRAAFHAFSRQSSKYDPAEADRAYSSFRPERIGAGTLYRLAFDGGWKRPTHDVDVSALFGAHAAPVAPDRLAPQRVEDILLQQPQGWIMRGIIPKNGLVLVYGQSGSGKSFLTLDIAGAIARGERWQERRVKQGGVIVVAGEGHIRLRLAAYMQQHGLAPADLARLRVVNTNLDLRNPRGHLAPLLASLRRAAEEMGGVSLIVLDTLNSMMGAGDENESADMGAMILAARSIMAALACSAVYIHHSGKDEQRGARGHSSLRAAVDTEIQVKAGSGIERLATITKQRDGETGVDFPFRLVTVDLGPSQDPDADSDERDSSCAVAPLVAVDLSGLRALKPLSGNAQALLKLVPSTPGRLATVRWDFYAKLGDMKPEAKKKAFQRAFSELVESGAIEESAGDVWLGAKP